MLVPSARVFGGVQSVQNRVAGRDERLRRGFSSCEQKPTLIRRKQLYSGEPGEEQSSFSAGTGQRKRAIDVELQLQEIGQSGPEPSVAPISVCDEPGERLIRVRCRRDGRSDEHTEE